MNDGDKAIEFIQCLTVPKGKLGGQLIQLMPWQKNFVTKLFGTLTDTGLRQYTTALLLLPKKNAKTTTAAAIAVYCLFCSDEIGGEIYMAANTRDQAAICFNAATAMIRADPYLNSQCKIVDSKKTIRYARTNSILQALSADAGDKNGKNASVIIYDEICEAKKPDLYEALTTGTASREQPLTLCISTAGDKGTIGHSLYEHALKVRDGIIEDPSFLGVIYEAKDGADWTDLKVWEAANPSWGITVEPNYAIKAIQSIQNMPTRLNEMLRYHLNIWVDRNVGWIPSEQWNACNCKYDLESLKGKRCYAAIDLASSVDITAVVLVFPLDDGKYAVVPRFYLPKGKAASRWRLDRAPYPTWISQGFITETTTDVADYDLVRKHINELGKVYQIQGIAIDRWNANQLSEQLKADGFHVEAFGQGYGSMNAPSKLMEELIISKKLLHNDNPVLKWMASNVVAETDAAGNVKPSKKRSTEKIDGIVAMIMALGVAIIKGGTQGKSVYESRGLLRL